MVFSMSIEMAFKMKIHDAGILKPTSRYRRENVTCMIFFQTSRNVLEKKCTGFWLTTILSRT